MSGWKRIGVIASAVWMVGAGIYTFDALSDRTETAAEFFYKQCADIRDEGIKNRDEYCDNEADRLAKSWYDQCERTGNCALDPRSDYYSSHNCENDYRAANPDHCSEENIKFVTDALPSERTEATVVAVVPVPFGWGFAYLVLFLVRWVKRGFNA